MQITQLMTSPLIMSIFEIGDFVAYDGKKQLKLCCTFKLRLNTWCLNFCAEFIDHVANFWWLVIMHFDVISYVICISNKVESLEKEELEKFYQRSCINIWSDLCYAIKNSWTKFRLTGTLIVHELLDSSCLIHQLKKSNAMSTVC